MLSEIRDRKLVQWVVAYIVGAFLLLQGLDVVTEGFPGFAWVLRVAIVLAVMGLPISVVIAWFHGEKGRQKVSGAELLIVKDGRSVFHEAYGWADREARKPVQRDAIWSIKSMSKPVTATAVLMLAEAGKLSLDDPVRRYIPGFAGGEGTRIRHLLAHTSGYGGGLAGGGGYDVYYFDALGEWVYDMAGQAPTGTIGAFGYSNFNYAALGYIVEVVSGLPVETFTQQRIIEPLGLEDTYTSFSPGMAWGERVPARYRWNVEAGDYERMWSAGDAQPWVIYPAAFGLWSTAMDYAAFMSMWLKEGRHEEVRLLEDATVKEALETHSYRDGEGVYGYGWFVDAAPDSGDMPLAFRHAGGDGTIAVAYPADSAMVVFLTHSQGIDHLGALQSRLGMLDLLDYPGPYMAWADAYDVAEVELTAAERARYVGTYRGRFSWMEDGPETVWEVWEEGGLLHMRYGEVGVLADHRMHLVPLGGDRFAPGRYGEEHLEAIDPYVSIRFAVDGGEATGLEAHVGGEVEYAARRTEPAMIHAEAAAKRNRVSIAEVIAAGLETEGAEAARARHRTLLNAGPDSVRFGAYYLHALGHRLLAEGRVEEAIAVFGMNAEAYPEVPVTQGGLGEAFRAAGRLEEAKQRFERAVRLSEEQAHPTWRMYWRIYRAHLERMTQQLEGP